MLKKIFLVFLLYIICAFESIRLFSLLLPPIFIINFTKSKRLRNVAIVVFIILWNGVFHYESLRQFFLSPLLKVSLSKTKFLFPPAGWIMFFTISDNFGYIQVYGVKDGRPQPLDPHDIIRTRTILFDNIHRNILSQVTNPSVRSSFCQYLRYRFPLFDDFLITSIYYSSITKRPYNRVEQLQYQCAEFK